MYVLYQQAIIWVLPVFSTIDEPSDLTFFRTQKVETFFSPFLHSALMMWGVGFANDVCLSPVLWTLDRKIKKSVMYLVSKVARYTILFFIFLP